MKTTRRLGFCHLGFSKPQLGDGWVKRFRKVVD